MLEYVAAANAAFAVVKKAIQNGKELHDCAKSIANFTHAHDDLKKAHNQKKNSIWTTFLGKEDDDLETFMHLEQLKQKEDELKQLMIYCGRPGLHSDWVKYQVEARKRRQKAEADRLKKISDLKDNALLAVAWLGGILVLGFITIMIVWGLVRKGIL